MNRVTIKSKETKSTVKAMVGQLYLRNEAGEVYILSSLYNDKYALVCLNDGYAWEHPSDTIEGAFASSKSDFKLVTNDKVEIEVV
jgi:hypothetical protein